MVPTKEEQAFYDMLEQNGHLVDVQRGDNVQRLPANVTHVRYPGGEIKRIRFTAGPARQPVPA